MRITIVLTLTAWLFLASCNSAFAKNSDIGYSQIHPAHPLYFLKTVREILEIKSAGTNNIKVLRYLEFSTRRIREVNSLVKNNNPDLIPPTLEKYWLNFTRLNGLVNVTDKNLITLVNDSLNQHINVLENIYSQTDNKRAKMAIRLTINRISEENMLLLDKINQVIKGDSKSALAEEIQKINLNQVLTCNLLIKQASESGLNDVEEIVLKERANKCQQNIAPLR